MTTKQKQVKQFVAERANYICETCGTYAGENGCIAHLISQSKVNRKLYGNDVIDSPLNQRWTCITSACNDAWNIGMNPAKCKELVEKIKAKS